MTARTNGLLAAAAEAAEWEEVHRQASGHAIGFGHCGGDALPPLLN